jgi:predicted outer membrane repeat protein
MLKGTHFRIGIVLAACVVLSVPLQASEIGEQIAAQIREETYRYFLDTQLFTRVGDNRGYDGPEHDLARDNIVAVFESYGLDVQLHAFDWYGDTYYNVVATQLGTVYPDAQYIVGAHYDSVSNPGADDNASGVTALLEVARILSVYETEYTVKYIAFDLEEEGLVGSEAYVDDHFADDIRGMISADMVAHDAGAYTVEIYGRSTSASVKQALQAAINEYGNGVVALRRSQLDASDHAPFERAGFAACLLIEDQYWSNPCYHGNCDSTSVPGSYIAYEYASNIVRGVAGYLADNALANYPYDCDGDGTADETQISADPMLDCNGNYILDVCEFAGDQDLNGNEVPDLCDVYAGTVDDCNGNWIPDELEPGYELDCNGNEVADFCDLSTHVSEDLNANGLLDECEIHGTIYVDDDAPDDPGPGDPNSSDPVENGSDDHPFDSISEAVALSVSGDQIVVRPGCYTGAPNRRVRPLGRRIAIRGENGPEGCVIDLQSHRHAFEFDFVEPPETVLEGFTIVNGRDYDSAALYICGGGPTVVNCVFESNTAYDGRGGAMFLWYSAPRFVNCVFRANRALAGQYYTGMGGGAYTVGGCPEFWDCTFTDNSADDRGGAIFASGGSLTVGNGIFWLNQAVLGPEFAVRSGSLRISYCDVTGGAAQLYVYGSGADLQWGPGNIDADPLFADPNNGDLHLLAGSPCIDAGANALVPPDYADLDGDGDMGEFTPLDLDYEGRFFDDPNTPDTGCGGPPIVDMGAYEFGGTGPQPCVGDFDGDGDVDLADLAELLGGYGEDDAGDLDCDGDTDLAALLGAYGDVCP